MTDIWATVHAERAALAEDLAALTPPQWSTPSLCAGWTVHDVLAHLVATAKETRVSFVLGMLRARGDFHRANAAGVTAERRADPAETLAAFRAVLDATATPPAPLESRLVEAFVHGEDIRRPLGLRGTYPADQVARGVVLQTRTSETFGGGRNLARGLTLRATDADLVLGEGPVVDGTALALLLTVCGRRGAVDELSGPGAARLTERLPA